MCEALLVTHLSFADDVLIFFDGSDTSLEGILSILDEFKVVSVFRDKSALFIDGGNFQFNQEIAHRFSLQQPSLPIRYLPRPLTSKK